MITRATFKPTSNAKTLSPTAVLRKILHLPEASDCTGLTLAIRGLQNPQALIFREVEPEDSSDHLRQRANGERVQALLVGDIVRELRGDVRSVVAAPCACNSLSQQKKGTHANYTQTVKTNQRQHDAVCS